MPAGNADQVGELLKRIAMLRRKGVTGATVVSSCLRRQIQPLQYRSHPGFEYTGLRDPSRFSSEKTSRDEAMVVGVLPSSSPRGIPRRVVMSRESPRSECDGARNTRI